MKHVKGIWCFEAVLYACGHPIKLTIGEMRVFSVLLNVPEYIWSRSMIDQARTHDAYHKPDFSPGMIDILVYRIRKRSNKQQDTRQLLHPITVSATNSTVIGMKLNF